jgi:DNA-binding NarL/FixJ family response regulator
LADEIYAEEWKQSLLKSDIIGLLEEKSGDKELHPLAARIIKLHCQGFKLNEIAEKLNSSSSTIQRIIKAAVKLVKRHYNNKN